ncbi:MAG: metal ABC transporter ATP-binding protein [Thermoprotei archaeon]|nr:MAG: metal ABC transporter ATP-binding protein [Thermoprotei archaeon]RLF25739.1 MAG: metal ABC transporter ATP-binding protein [Thermoprotei archaeon]
MLRFQFKVYVHKDISASLGIQSGELLEVGNIAEKSAQIITLENVTVGYGREIVLKDLTVTFQGPGLVQVIGPNGAGKTTLLRTILGLIKPIKGRILINGIDVTGKPSKAGPLIGYVPQIMVVKGEEYPVSAWEYVAMSLLLHKKKWPRIGSGESVKAVRFILRIVGVPEELWHKPMWELSGGQRQRVLLARALVYNPPIILMDEPLSNVDPAGRAELAKLIGELSHQRLILVTSHDPTLLMPYTKEVLLLNREYYMIGAPKDVFKIEYLKNIYGESVVNLGEHMHISNSHYR